MLTCLLFSLSLCHIVGAILRGFLPQTVLLFNFLLITEYFLYCIDLPSVRFFLKKFPNLLALNGNSREDATETLEEEFSHLQLESFEPSFFSQPIDQQWFQIREMKNVLNQPKYETLAFFMLGLLTIPHSNSECERIFSQVRKNKTEIFC